MSIWGKLIGGTAGFALGGPIGAIIGVMVAGAINKNIAPSSKIFQFSFNNRASQYEILINYNLSEIKKIKKKFKIIESNNNCHLIKYSHD